MTEFRLLPVSLNKKEIESYALKLAEVCAHRTQVEDERKKAMGDFNQQIKADNETIKNLVEAIQNGYEEKDIECDYKKNPEAGTMETIRLDTREVIDTRPLEANELNEEMDFGDGDNKEKKDAKK